MWKLEWIKIHDEYGIKELAKNAVNVTDDMLINWIKIKSLILENQYVEQYVNRVVVVDNGE